MGQAHAPLQAGEPYSPWARDLNGASDPALCDLVAQGNLNALATIYDRHIEAVWRAALQFSANVATAEQAVSAAFLHVWRNPKADGGVTLLARLLSNVVHEVRTSSRLREDST